MLPVTMQQATLGSTSSSSNALETSFMSPSQRAFKALGRFSVITATFSPSPFFSTLINSNEDDVGEDVEKRRGERQMGNVDDVSVQRKIRAKLSKRIRKCLLNG